MEKMNMWIYSLSNDRNVLSGEDSGQRVIGIGGDSSGKIQFNSYDGDGHKISTSMDKYRWYHLLGTVTANGKMEFFVNGQSVGTNSTSELANNTPEWYIGAADLADSPGYWPGRISDARIYDRVLSSQEIQTLYEWGNGDYTDRSYHDGTDTGAVSRWKFNDDSDTSNAVDSWSSNNGDISGAVYYPDSARGKSLSFDGSNDSVSVSSQELDIPESKSVSAWVKMEDAASSEYQRVFQTGTDSGGRAYEMWIEDENSGVSFGRAVFRLNHDQSPSSKTCEYVIPDFDYDQWYHYTNGEMRLYINGVLRQVVSYSEQIGSETDHYIGNWADEGDRPWNGLIDDVRVYNRALDSSEVQQLYQWGTRGRDMRKLTANSRGDQ
jgi:hypothetical protein